jgi:hypothetical protein
VSPLAPGHLTGEAARYFDLTLPLLSAGGAADSASPRSGGGIIDLSTLAAPAALEAGDRVFA